MLSFSELNSYFINYISLRRLLILNLFLFSIDLSVKEKKEDPRIAGAEDAAIIGVTAPIDLSPDTKPEYTEEARDKKITGTLTLEVIIADSGEVLQVRSVGKKLGFGLDEEAVSIYRRKKFSPSFLDGKAVTVKILIPVRYSLLPNN